MHGANLFLFRVRLPFMHSTSSPVQSLSYLFSWMSWTVEHSSLIVWCYVLWYLNVGIKWLIQHAYEECWLFLCISFCWDFLGQFVPIGPLWWWSSLFYWLNKLDLGVIVYIGTYKTHVELVKLVSNTFVACSISGLYLKPGLSFLVNITSSKLFSACCW